jgi:hypothetical protein
MRDMVERKRAAAGERNRAARLSAKDVRDIRQLVTDVGLRMAACRFWREARASLRRARALLCT